MLGLAKYWAYKIARFKLFANGGDEETWTLDLTIMSRAL